MVLHTFSVDAFCCSMGCTGISGQALYEGNTERKIETAKTKIKAKIKASTN